MDDQAYEILLRLFGPAKKASPITLNGDGTARLHVFGSTRPAVIDSADVPIVAPYRWLITANGYVLGGSRFLLHRFLLLPPAGVLVDHRDGDRLNCRRSNLRLADHLQNARNMRKRRGQSGYRGVYRHGTSGLWCARIRAGKERSSRLIGYFKDPALAARAYDEAAIRLHGEFAVLNF